MRTCLEGYNDVAMSQMLPDQQPDALSVSVYCVTSSILRFGIEMACRKGISDPSSTRVAVTTTKYISGDSASQLLQSPDDLLSSCLGCGSGVNSCDGASPGIQE